MKTNNFEYLISMIKQDEHFINKLPQETQLDIVNYDTRMTYALSPEMQLIAVKQNGNALNGIKEQTRALCVAAVEQCGMAVQYVKEEFRTPEVLQTAVETDSNVFLLNIKPDEQTPEMCITAVSADATLLKHVVEQTPEICMAAVQKSGTSLVFVEEQTPEICKAALMNTTLIFSDINDKTPELCMLAVSKFGRCLQHIDPKDQTPELCITAIKNDYRALSHVENQTFEICAEAVRQNAKAIRNVRNLHPKLREDLVKENVEALLYVRQSPKLCLAVTQYDASAIQYVKDPFLEACLAALPTETNNSSMELLTSADAQDFENNINALSENQMQL